jgi:hypothetical protein
MFPVLFAQGTQVLGMYYAICINISTSSVTDYAFLLRNESEISINNHSSENPQNKGHNFQTSPGTHQQ